MRLQRTTKTRRPVRPAPVPAGLPERGFGAPSMEDAAPARRRRRPSRRAVALIGFLLVLGAGIAAAIVLTMPRLERVQVDTLTNDASPTLQLRVAHPGSLTAGQVEARVGDVRVAQDHIAVDGSSIELRMPRLTDGSHDVLVRVHHAGLVRTTLEERFELTIDTEAPAARVVAPLPTRDAESAYVQRGVLAVTKLPLQLTVGAEPGSTLRVSSDAAGAKPVTADASETTRRTVDVALPEGAQQLRIVATDAAGNETVRELKVLVDTAGPALTVRVPRLVKSAALDLPIAARDTHGVTVTVKLDGRTLEEPVKVAASTPAPFASATNSDETTDENASDEGGATANATDPSDATTNSGGEGDADSADEPKVDAPISLRGTISLEDGAYEGRHALEVVATDSLGTKTTFKRTLLVDSTEQLGDVAGLRAGARGADVAQLHAALIEQQVVSKAGLGADLTNRTFGAPTRAAVSKYQSREGMSVDGVAGADTIAGLTLKIVVDRSSNTLTLYRVGKVVKTWGVATGAAEFPTPTGDFTIQTMQKNPTWTPPDSDWAKDAKVIPPGPDNPLGTRWMAIAGTVGIHGTNNPASIGYSVSHGCIRMAIPDVEELYDMVAIGTRVTVV